MSTKEQSFTKVPDNLHSIIWSAEVHPKSQTVCYKFRLKIAVQLRKNLNHKLDNSSNKISSHCGRGYIQGINYGWLTCWWTLEPGSDITMSLYINNQQPEQNQALWWLDLLTGNSTQPAQFSHQNNNRAAGCQLAQRHTQTKSAQHHNSVTLVCSLTPPQECF